MDRTYRNIHVKEINNSKFYFEVTATNVFTDEIKTFEYHTNSHGEGLWLGDQQIEGTCQFSGGKNIREAIRRYVASL